MKRPAHFQSLHRSWFAPRRTRGVDKTGVAVALAFVVALGLIAGGRGEKPADQHDSLSPTYLSADIVPDQPATLPFGQDDRTAVQDVARMPLDPSESTRR